MVQVFGWLVLPQEAEVVVDRLWAMRRLLIGNCWSRVVGSWLIIMVCSMVVSREIVLEIKRSST